MPRREELGLAIGSETGSRGRLCFLERAANGLHERAERAVRQRRARSTPTRSAAANAGSASQSGSSIHSPTPCSRRNRVVDPRHSCVARCSCAARVEELRHRDSRVRRVVGTARSALAERDDPGRRGRARRSICVTRSGGPGASTSPPRAIRCGQYVNRPVGSCGPTIRPGRTTSARSSKTSRTASSQSALSGP